ncbi:hypothetical protein SLOPH_2274, partial [Spraguea lophii 42_110]
MFNYLSSMLRTYFTKQTSNKRRKPNTHENPIKTTLDTDNLENIVAETSLSVREIFQRSLNDTAIGDALLKKSKRRIEDMDDIFKHKLIIDEGMKESITGIAGYENFIKREYERIYPYGAMSYLDNNENKVKINNLVRNNNKVNKIYHNHKPDMILSVSTDNNCFRCMETDIDNIYKQKYINLVKDIIRRLTNIVVKRENNINRYNSHNDLLRTNSFDWILNSSYNKSDKIKEINVLNEIKDVILKNVDNNCIEKDVRELENKLKRADNKLMEEYEKGFKELFEYNKRENEIRNEYDKEKIMINNDMNNIKQVTINEVPEIKEIKNEEINESINIQSDDKPEISESIGIQSDNKINDKPLFSSFSEETKTDYLSTSEETKDADNKPKFSFNFNNTVVDNKGLSNNVMTNNTLTDSKKPTPSIFNNISKEPTSSIFNNMTKEPTSNIFNNISKEATSNLFSNISKEPKVEEIELTKEKEQQKPSIFNQQNNNEIKKDVIFTFNQEDKKKDIISESKNITENLSLFKKDTQEIRTEEPQPIKPISLFNIPQQQNTTSEYNNANNTMPSFLQPQFNPFENSKRKINVQEPLFKRNETLTFSGINNNISDMNNSIGNTTNNIGNINNVGNTTNNINNTANTMFTTTPFNLNNTMNTNNGIGNTFNPSISTNNTNTSLFGNIPNINTEEKKKSEESLFNTLSGNDSTNPFEALLNYNNDTDKGN